MEENTNWGQSVTGILIRQGKVLLARHTYGTGKGMLIVPGGYVKIGETPMDALKREFLEETGIVVEPGKIIAVRFNSHDWYVAFRRIMFPGRRFPTTMRMMKFCGWKRRRHFCGTMFRI